MFEAMFAVLFALCTSTLVAEDPASGQFSGRVVADDGQPAEGITVHIIPVKNGRMAARYSVQTTETAVDGTFRFDNVDGSAVRAWAEQGEMTSAEKRWGSTFKLDSDKPITLKLRRGCGFDVTVQEAKSGKPIEGAEIAFVWTDVKRSFRTNADGNAKIVGLAADDWDFLVKRAGLATVHRRVPAPQPGSTSKLVFGMSPGGSITGFVRDGEGKVVPGARLYAGLQGISMSRVTDGRTDKEGRFKLTGLPIGTPLEISVSAPECNSTRTNLSLRSDLPELTRDLPISRIKYAGDGYFLVVNEDGDAVSGATLVNRGRSSSNTRKQVTKEDGRADLSKLYRRYDGVRVVAQAEGFIPQRVEVDLKASAESPQKVTLKPGKAVRGRVVDANEKPVSGVRIYYNEGEHGELLGGRVVTDKSGEFEITGLPDDSTYTVYTPAGFAPIDDQKLPLGGDEPFVIRMQLESVLRVRAIDSKTGKTIPEFNVRLGFCRDRRPGDPQVSGISATLTQQGMDVLGDKKEFRLGKLAEGSPYAITVTAEGYEPQTLARVVAVRADKAKKPVDVRLKMDTAPRSTISGRIIVGSKPAVGVTVHLIVGRVKPDGRNWPGYNWSNISRGYTRRDRDCLYYASATTRRSGKFEFANAKLGPWVEIFHTGGNAAPTRYPDLRDQALERLLLKADSPASITVTVDMKKFPDGSGLTLSDRSQQRRPNFSALDYKSLELRDGKATSKHLPPGSYSLTLQGKRTPEGRGGGFRVSSLKTIEVELKPGENKFEF